MEQQLEELDNYNSDNAGINMVPAVKMTVLLLVELQNEKVCALLPLCRKQSGQRVKSLETISALAS